MSKECAKQQKKLLINMHLTIKIMKGFFIRLQKDWMELIKSPMGLCMKGGRRKLKGESNVVKYISQLPWQFTCKPKKK